MSRRKVTDDGAGTPLEERAAPAHDSSMQPLDGSIEEAAVPVLATVGARRRSRAVLWWIGGLVLTVVVGLGAVLGARLGTDPTLVSSPLIGKPAPDLEWPYLERDGALQLADLRGEVVVVNFWASWCVPCRTEHAELVAAADAYADAGAGVRFVGVNYQDQKATAVAFLDELGRGERYEYVVDSGSKGAVDFGVYGVPETFIIDREGTIVAKIVGASNFSLLASTLDKVLANKTPGEIVNGPVQKEAN